ncbi:MAG: acyl-CoA dehydrogenase family protein [Actinobacteria bacterium]|nr:acyl-CoA dehydrogenase family protein [Actinomycetota bacterium]
MKLALSESQSMLRDTVARLFADEATPERLRAAEATGVDQALWDKLVELGIIGIRSVAPQDGGMTLFDAVIVAEEAGRTVAPVPLIEAIVATGLLHRAGAPDALLSAVDGGAPATIALKPVEPGTSQVVLGGSSAHVVVALEGNELIAFTGLGAARVPGLSVVDEGEVGGEGAGDLAGGQDAPADGSGGCGHAPTVVHPTWRCPAGRRRRIIRPVGPTCHDTARRMTTL